MRSINKILGIAFTAMLLLMLKPAKTQAQPGVEVSYQTFYDELSPYGTWVDDPDYGDVWVPDVEDGFQPYATRGHWALTEYGNTWVSDYDWGWAPFHYGRWRFDDYYGWEWIPGSEWGPAWVNWRTGGDYYAWAPLGPRVSIDISFGNDYSIPDAYWICAPRIYINSPRIYDYYVPRSRVVNIIRRTTIINNVYVNNNRRFVSGPRAQEIERYTHQRPQIYSLGNSSRPGTTVIQNNTINVYRPTIIRNNRGEDRPRPTRVVDANAYRNQHPDAGIANKSNGATTHHENSSRLAQTARNTQPDNNNNGVVRVNRPGVANPPANGNNNGTPSNINPNSNRRFGGRDGRNTNGTGTQPAQPATGTPANTTPNNPNANPNANGRFGGRDGRNTNGAPNNTNPANPNNGAGAQPAQPATGSPANTTPNNPNNNWRGNRGNGTTPQQAPTNQPEVKPAVVPNNPNPTMPNPDNGRFNRSRNRPSTATPTTQPQQQIPSVQPQQSNQDQAAKQQADQQAAQQRQQQQQARQQQMQQQRQQQDQARQQAAQQRQQQQPQAQPQQQRPQAQPQQQRQPQQQPQQQPQAQPQQQRPQPQPQQQRPQQQPRQQRPPQQQRPQAQPQQPRPRPVVVEQKKEDKPPM